MDFGFNLNRTANASAWRLLPNRWDFVAFPLIISLIAMAAIGFHQTMAPIATLKTQVISLDPSNLPEYALRTTLRMLAAMFASLVFTLVYGTLAAKSRRAEKVLVPTLDILQSVPVLGYISFTVTFLIWNMMMSVSGGWFFVVASEAITVGNNTITLPGIGAYLAQAEIEVPFKHPRNRLDTAFRSLVDEIYAKMTARRSDEATKQTLEFGSRLPHVSTNLLAGLIEMLAVAPYNGRADMPVIARSLHLEVDDLFPIAEMLQHLGFAELCEGDIFLTPAAHVFADLGTHERKMMFADHLLKHVPLAARIKKVLNERPGHRAPRVRFEQELEDFLSDGAAEDTLDSVINWGRYGEVFSYNDQTELFSLEDVES